MNGAPAPGFVGELGGDGFGFGFHPELADGNQDDEQDGA